MSEQTFWTFDATLCVGVEPSKKDKIGMWEPDWGGHARLLRVLKGLGFSIEEDPRIVKHYRILRRYHRVGRSKDLFVHCETYATGSKFEFYQEIVTENRNGGRYDFAKVAKMPYLVRKRFEWAMAALKADLLARGFVENAKIESPNPDPLAYFNGHWDGEYEKKRGTHRFERDESGWPSAREIGCWSTKDRDGKPLTHGAFRYARDHRGYLIRGRVYGGINGMWLMVYGPGKRDFTHKSAHEFFAYSPGMLRKQYPDPKSAQRRASERVRRQMAKAVSAEDFEVAARLRDEARRIESHMRAA
jgi:hypothetical protein